MVDFLLQSRYNYDQLIEIIRILRSEEGCPWAREQTHESIRRNFLEETYEAVEAIDLRDLELLREELGDVLLQVVLHAQIAREAGEFTIDDVVDGLCKKLIVRHPHVFGSVEVSGAGEVLRNWDAIKSETKGIESRTEAMNSIARSLPSLMRAEKIQAKAASVGFDWEEIGGALDKLQEEVDELRAAIPDGQAVEELGDVLFAAVNVARFLKTDAEHTLERASEKFVARFSHMEKKAAEGGRPLSDLTLGEMDVLWEESKRA